MESPNPTAAVTTAGSEKSSCWPCRLTGAGSAALILAAFYILLLASLSEKSATVDELGHATAGYTYWHFHDYRFDPENGNLPQRLAALPLLCGDFRPPRTAGLGWERFNLLDFSAQWFSHLGNDAQTMLARGRAAIGLLAVALGALIWWWARKLFGPWGGLISLLLYALNPTVLANGALITSDLAAALFFLAATYGIWSVLEKITVGRVLASAFALGGLFVSKMSAALIFPLAAILIAARLLDRRPLPVEIGLPREFADRGPRLLAILAAVAVHIAIVYGMVWGFYGFRYSLLGRETTAAHRELLSEEWDLVAGHEQPRHLLEHLSLSSEQNERATEILKLYNVGLAEWQIKTREALMEVRAKILSPEQAGRLDAMLAAPPHSPVPHLIDFCRRHRLLPEAYLLGHAIVWEASGRRRSFFNGEFSVFGWRWFFPYTFLVKTPLPLFAVMLFAAAAIALRPRSFYAALPLGTLFALYWLAAIFSHLNIGHRHILPTYPPLFILCGAAGVWLEALWPANCGPTSARFGRSASFAGVALCLVLIVLAAETAFFYPNYLAYFNGIVRPSRAYRHLVDSSLDWGQDLPAAARYIARHAPSGPAYFSYFGNDSPKDYGVSAYMIHSNGAEAQALAAPMLDQPLPIMRANLMLPYLRQKLVDYDYVGRGASARELHFYFLQKPERLRLRGGLYLVSASMLETIMPGPWGAWNAAYEDAYQQLRELVRPLADDNEYLRRSALQYYPLQQWALYLDAYDQYRFARLAAWLREREPDDMINYSILVYKLSNSDVDRMLDGPPPPFGPNAMEQEHGSSGP